MDRMNELLIEPPNWAILQIAGRGGIKLPPRQSRWPVAGRVPRVEQTTKDKADAEIARRWKGFAREKIFIPPGNLQNWEYRFWAGSEYSGSFQAICRCCQAPVSAGGPYGRRLHYKATGCSWKLVRAYRELKSHKLCVICRMPINFHRLRRWGLDFCNHYCLRTFMFRTAQPPLLRTVLEDLERAGYPDKDGNADLRLQHSS